jgi:hypothetical protein
MRKGGKAVRALWLGHEREVASSHLLQEFELEILIVREREIGSIPCLGG